MDLNLNEWEYGYRVEHTTTGRTGTVVDIDDQIPDELTVWLQIRWDDTEEREWLDSEAFIYANEAPEYDTYSEWEGR